LKKSDCFISVIIGISLAIAGLNAVWAPNDKLDLALFFALLFGGVGGLIVEAIIIVIVRVKRLRLRTTFFLLLFMPSLLIVVPTKIITQYTSYLEWKRNEQWMEIQSRVNFNTKEYRKLLEKVHNNTATDLEASAVQSFWRRHAPDELPFLTRRFMNDKYFILNVLNSDLLNESLIREIHIVYAEKPDDHIFNSIVSSTITPDDILSDISKYTGWLGGNQAAASRTLAKKTLRKYPDATTSNLIAAVQNKAITEEHRVHAIELSKNGVVPDAEMDLLVIEFLKDAEFITNMLKHRQIPPRLLRHVFDHYKKLLSSSSDKESADKIIHLIAENPQTPINILNEILIAKGFDGWITGKARDNLQRYPRNNLLCVP
jgi:hypothetical protein